jgi:dCMP deaminase
MPNAPDDRPEAPDWPKYFESWDEYFLAIAMTVARKSKDPRCQVGAIIVSPERLILSSGFNGLARGVFDRDELLDDVDEKIRWICHAEANALFNAARVGARLAGATIYVTKFPCFACCNGIIQAGIVRVYTHDSKYWSDDPADRDHTRKPQILKEGGVVVDAPFHPKFTPTQPLTWSAQPREQLAGEARKGPVRAPSPEASPAAGAEEPQKKSG